MSGVFAKHFDYVILSGEWTQVMENLHQMADSITRIKETNPYWK